MPEHDEQEIPYLNYAMTSTRLCPVMWRCGSFPSFSAVLDHCRTEHPLYRGGGQEQEPVVCGSGGTPSYGQGLGIAFWMARVDEVLADPRFLVPMDPAVVQGDVA